ncbi:MAG TPA: branched-chain amino acid ABC transporter permease [Castellaniella sp.]|uniref:branched-chain amino acid ABC transporter permease n=1 Tax=Castellaniella sp. TaxID=1955812 RepID=UPI002EFC4E16
MTDLILQSIYSGILQGGLYALIGLGLALVFGTMNVINFAHGELILLAAYMAYMVETQLGISPLFAIPVALVLVCLCSVIIYWLISLIRADRELNSLILSYGVAVIMTNAFLFIWKADPHSTGSAWLQDAFVVGPLFSMRAQVLFFIIAAILLVGLWWWLSRSWYGRAVRAVASNRAAAKLMGINPNTTEIISFLIAGILASFAGVAIFSYEVIQPSIGESLTIKAFIITVLAGLGSIPGVLIGGILLGLVEALTATLYSSALQELVAMVLFLLVLFFMPNGLFGLKARRG